MTFWGKVKDVTWYFIHIIIWFAICQIFEWGFRFENKRFLYYYYCKISGTSVTRFVYFKLSKCFRLLLHRYQTFYYTLGRCCHRKIKNSHFLFNLPPELPIHFLGKAIVEIDLIQQKSIVRFKYY